MTDYLDIKIKFKLLIKYISQALFLFVKINKISLRYVISEAIQAYHQYVSIEFHNFESKLYRYMDLLIYIKTRYIDYNINMISIKDVTTHRYNGEQLIKISKIDTVFKCFDTAIDINWYNPFKIWLDNNIESQDVRLFDDLNISCLMFSCYLKNGCYYVVSPIVEVDKYLLKYYALNYLKYLIRKDYKNDSL